MSALKSLCLDCQQIIPGGERAGHCATCHQTFIGLTSFDKHRVGEHGVNRRCELQPYTLETVDHQIRYGHWPDKNGHWHYGRRYTRDEVQARFTPQSL